MNRLQQGEIRESESKAGEAASPGGLSLSVSVSSGRKVINILFGGGRAPGIPEHSTAVPFSRFIGMRVEEEVE